MVDEDVSLRHHHGAEQRVLHNAHHRLVALRTDDLPGHSHDFSDLSERLKGLRNVHVHLITVKVCVVGSRHR